MDYECFLNLFGIRKPRSTRKIIKEKESSDETRLTAFHKIFNKNLSLKLIERFLNAHDMHLIVQNLDCLMFIADRSDSRYYTAYKTFEEISKSLNIY